MTTFFVYINIREKWGKIVAPITGQSLLVSFLNPTGVQRAQRSGVAFRGVSNPVRNANIASIKYERAPEHGATVAVTDRNGNPLLPGYMPDGLKLDCLA